jgi:multidrug transporter EmrE-like cation transporter
VIAYLVVYVALSTSGLLLLRSRLGGGETLASLASDPRLLLGAACYAASFLVWLLALRHFEITRAFPVFLGASYIAVTVGAVLILGEHLGPVRLAGVVLIGGGIFLVGR